MFSTSKQYSYWNRTTVEPGPTNRHPWAADTCSTWIEFLESGLLLHLATRDTNGFWKNMLSMTNNCYATCRYGQSFDAMPGLQSKKWQMTADPVVYHTLYTETRSQPMDTSTHSGKMWDNVYSCTCTSYGICQHTWNTHRSISPTVPGIVCVSTRVWWVNSWIPFLEYSPAISGR